MFSTHVIRTKYQYSEDGMPYSELEEILQEVDDLREIQAQKDIEIQVLEGKVADAAREVLEMKALVDGHVH